MSIVKINAITVPAEHGEELAERFAQRAGSVDSQDGFEGFELLRPTDGRTTWLVVTRWRDEAAYQAWAASDDFTRAHHRADGATDAGAPGRPAMGISAEVWSYAVATGSSQH